MPLGEQAGSKFFTPVHGRYAVRLMSIHDGKPVTYPATDTQAARTAVPAIWAFALYTPDGQPVRDPTNPEQVPAIAESMSGQSTGFGKDGHPAKGRVWLNAFTQGLGLAFPDEADVELVGQLVNQSIGAWAWFTWGPNPDKRSKTATIVREVSPMIPQPALSPLPLIVAAPAAAVAPMTPPPSFAPAAPAAAPVFAAPAVEAPAAPVFAAPAAPVFAPPVAEVVATPVFATITTVPAFAPVAVGEATPTIPAMVFPTS